MESTTTDDSSTEPSPPEQLPEQENICELPQSLSADIQQSAADSTRGSGARTSSSKLSGFVLDTPEKCDSRDQTFTEDEHTMKGITDISAFSADSEVLHEENAESEPFLPRRSSRPVGQGSSQLMDSSIDNLNLFYGSLTDMKHHFFFVYTENYLLCIYI